MMDNGSYQGFIYQWTWLGSCKITQINSNPINFSLQYLRSSDSAEMKTWFTVDPYNVDKWAESCVNTYVCGPQNVRESRDSHFWHSRELFSTGCLSTPKTLRTSVTVQTQEEVMEHWRSCVRVCVFLCEQNAATIPAWCHARRRGRVMASLALCSFTCHREQTTNGSVRLRIDSAEVPHAHAHTQTNTRVLRHAWCCVRASGPEGHRHLFDTIKNLMLLWWKLLEIEFHFVCACVMVVQVHAGN